MLRYLISFFIRNQSKLALLKRCFFLLLLILGNKISIAQAGYDTVKILFPINITKLDNVAKKKLDSLARYNSKNNLLIYGYADYLGNEPANMGLANGRAENVKNYLLSQKIKAQQILICEGIGEVKRNLPKSQDGYPEDRRVAIFIKKEQNNTAVKTETVQKVKKGIQVAEIKEDGKMIPLEKKAAVSKPTTNNVSEHLLVGLKTKAPTTPIKEIKAGPKVILQSRFEELSALKVNEVMRIEAIHFQPTRHFITPESEPILQELLQTLKTYPELAINIEGHVCCMQGDGDAMDTDTHEYKLSENRARYIYQYLIDNGIETKRLGFIGHGKRRPIIPYETTEEDAQKNRRVEIRVVRN